MPRKPILVLAAFLLALAAGFATISLTITLKPPAKMAAGEALIGGPFTAIDHTGRTVTDKDFLGKHMFVFFGFTYCPDVCPTQLQVMSEALRQMGDEAEAITPVFVSIDPARDTPDVLKDYVANFHPRMVGLTGTPEQVAGVAKAFRVYYARAESTSAPDGYLMDHTSIIYLMGPDGKFLNHFSYSTDAIALAKALGQAIKN